MGRATRLGEPARSRQEARARPAQTTSPAPAVRSPLAALQRSIGNGAVGRLVQGRLRVGPPGDRFEREADHVAQQVTRRPAAGKVPDVPPRPQTPAAPATEPGALPSAGQPLDPATRACFEPRFGRDLSRVRVHTGSPAGRSALALNAQAYTRGDDMVFAPGRFAPGTHDGQRLIAHELAHVVQQSSGHAPPAGLIQRKLLVRDKPRPKHVRALFDLLESPAGLTLRYDPSSEEVSIGAARAQPPSLSVRLRLEEIIDDPRFDAELRLGGPRAGVSFGAFPQSGPLIQEIDIEDLTRLEAGAPGHGVAILLHEIVENHHAHAFGRDFEPAHEAALVAERQAASELVRPGGRVARAIVDRGKGAIRWVLDYEQYFLVYDRDPKTGVVTSSWQSPRVRVASFAIDGFAHGSDAVPDKAQPVIAAVANALRMSPAATVRIEAGGQDSRLALRRAGKVQEAVLDHGKDRKLHGFDLRSGFNFNLVATGQSREGLLIVVDQPDTEVAGYRGSLVKAWLTGKSRRQAPTKVGVPDWRPRR